MEVCNLGSSVVAYISTDFIGCAFFCHNTPKGPKSFSRAGTKIWMGMRILKDAVVGDGVALSGAVVDVERAAR